MAADTLKGNGITNLDATAPGPLANTTGIYGPHYVKRIDDYVTPTTGGLASTSSIYKVVRVPCNVKLKRIVLNADSALDTNGTPTLKLNVGAYYSDSANDGTAAANQGALISANCFASALAFTTTFQNVDATGAFGAAKRDQELWQALGLTSNPGGFFDIVVAVQTVAATAASAALQVAVEFSV